ncbi:MAG: hypothetical protein WBM69_27380 [Desulfobacterales bacterium]
MKSNIEALDGHPAHRRLKHNLAALFKNEVIKGLGDIISGVVLIGIGFVSGG